MLKTEMNCGGIKNGDAWEKTNDYSLASKDPKSKQYVGSAIPKVYGGFTNNFSWKGLNLSVFFSYSVGGKMYDSNYQRLMHAGSLGHAWHKDILKRWRKPGDVTDVPRIEKGNRYISRSSNRFLKDASTCRCVTSIFPIRFLRSGVAVWECRPSRCL